MSAATKPRGIRLVPFGAWALVLGVVGLVLAIAFSAIDYNASETVEGALTGPPPLWIEVMAKVASATMAIGAGALVLAAVHRRHRR
ncbi:hypothetical protein [Agromyces mangrovi Wang et al. 2018]|uniref:hypothetical protein n=1 Tax=Agromyces mangrovi TaxID=1858653 RepID=UPI002572F6C8|nr:hypothetical protein [Agromyces mangrovi]